MADEAWRGGVSDRGLYSHLSHKGPHMRSSHIVTLILKFVPDAPCTHEGIYCMNPVDETMSSLSLSLTG